MMIWPNSVDELSVRRTFSVALMYSVVPTIHPSSIIQEVVRERNVGKEKAHLPRGSGLYQQKRNDVDLSPVMLTKNCW